jgi:signal-transduction protein with cAMP-binding, CBS, and nucleotidyltransferase domain
MSELLTIEGSVTISEAADKMVKQGIGSIIITEASKPVGIITKSDLLSRVIVAYKDPKIHKAKDIMSSPLISINSETTVLDAMKELRRRNIRRILVEKNGELVGIISETDIIRAISIASLTQFSTLLRRQP